MPSTPQSYRGRQLSSLSFCARTTLNGRFLIGTYQGSGEEATPTVFYQEADTGGNGSVLTLLRFDGLGRSSAVQSDQ
ncbi:hypothetical protein BaRGS_00035499 [Batillaria attramentaria]|uniref:Uncharacterized protein n=1 Tax=Batillaria attramentaria TaxID=370345 RepID=A0ABD0JE51_9CAEN